MVLKLSSLLYVMVYRRIPKVKTSLHGLFLSKMAEYEPMFVLFVASRDDIKKYRSLSKERSIIKDTKTGSTFVIRSSCSGC